MDIAIEEFEIVGNHVKALASENATVVVGAVIDPEMTDELRVTVVATGLGGDRRPQFGIVDNGFKKASGSDVTSSSTQTSSSMYVPSFASQGTNTTEEPATTSQTESKEQSSTSTSSSSSATNTSSSSANKTDKSEGGDYFDIPAFLRKQAD
jgi:cell division protein FtsZ